MDKEEFVQTVVVLVVAMIGFAATFIGIYLMVSLGAALIVCGLFLVAAAVGHANLKEPECKR